jgi:hypothetical protein
LQAAVALAVLVHVVVLGYLAWSSIGYFLAVSAISGLPRYRLPTMRYYPTLAAWGWCNCAWGSKAVSVPRLASA